jgi:pimeloyl-ACP methyl ester carboxylesterase
MPRRAPAVVQDLVNQYDPAVLELGRPSARLRLVGAGPEAVDVHLDGRAPRIVAAGRRRPDALLSADEQTWREIAEDVRGGMNAYCAGRLRVRHDLHLGVGFLAATSAGGEGGLRMRHLDTAVGAMSVTEAGAGASYTPPFFARAVVALMDALELQRAHVVGNSLGGRVALETGLRYPERVRRLGLLALSLAWLRDRPWAPLLRLV